MTDDAEPSPLMLPVSNTVSASTLISVSVPFFSAIAPRTAKVQFVSVIRPSPHAPLLAMVLPPMAVAPPLNAVQVVTPPDWFQVVEGGQAGLPGTDWKLSVPISNTPPVIVTSVLSTCVCMLS